MQETDGRGKGTTGREPGGGDPHAMDRSAPPGVFAGALPPSSVETHRRSIRGCFFRTMAEQIGAVRFLATKIAVNSRRQAPGRGLGLKSYLSNSLRLRGRFAGEPPDGPPKSSRQRPPPPTKPGGFRVANKALSASHQGPGKLRHRSTAQANPLERKGVTAHPFATAWWCSRLRGSGKDRFSANCGEASWPML
jgi:hypothetical protein